MFTVELGQAWKKRDDALGAHDAVSLSFDGVNVLPGVAEESLPRVVQELSLALSALVVEGDRAAQVSLEESGIELCFWRLPGFDVELQIIDYGQPLKRVGPIHHVELAELKDAIVRCARAFMREVSGVASAMPAAQFSEIERTLRVVESTLLREFDATGSLLEFHGEFEGPDVGFAAHDKGGRLLSWSKKTRACLPALLIEGQVTVGGMTAFESPFLMLQRLARNAAAQGFVVMNAQRIEAAAIFAAGFELTVQLRRHHPSLASNPYVESLQVRCADGLAALKQPVTTSDGDTPIAELRTKGAAQPLMKHGVARRVKLDLKWSAAVALGEEGGRLVMAKGQLIAASTHSVHAFSPKGQSHLRLLAARGIAVADSGALLLSEPSRLLGFSASRLKSKSKKPVGASWVRTNDASTIGTTLFEAGPVAVTSLNNRGVLAFDWLTGRELWRIDPARTQRGYLSVAGSRVLLATDGGEVLGFDAVDGRARFRIRASLSAVHPGIFDGHHALFVLSSSELTKVLMCDAFGTATTPAGTVVWACDLPLAHPSPLVHAKRRTFVAGESKGKTSVCCIDQRGQLLWQRAVTCDARTTRLAAFESGVIASDARGVAVRLLPDGQIDWVLGASGDELGVPLLPKLSRKMLVLPGPAIRVVEPMTGRVVSELEAGPHVGDLQVDAKFNLYVYVEPGVVHVYAPSTLLSVVG